MSEFLLTFRESIPLEALALSTGGRDIVLSVHWEETVLITRRRLSSDLRCGENHLQFHCAGSTFTCDLSCSLRWVDLPCVSNSTIIYWIRRSRIPRYLRELSWVELSHLRWALACRLNQVSQPVAGYLHISPLEKYYFRVFAPLLLADGVYNTVEEAIRFAVKDYYRRFHFLYPLPAACLNRLVLVVRAR